MQKVLLLVFIHGFKGTDLTFHNFPKDLRALLSHSLPKVRILSVVYPQFETRGDLKACVARFKEWLQNKVIDLEIANREGQEAPAASTVDPSVHVVLCGHSMGGIVAAETLLSIARDEAVPDARYANDTTNSTTTTQGEGQSSRRANLTTPSPEERASSAPPRQQRATMFPYIEAILAFDTPYLGISPGVLAHGAEMQINHATTAYKAYDTASSFFGWGNRSATTQAAANASASAGQGAGWQRWGTFAMVGGAAAAIAGIAGAAYLNWNQINQGLEWAGSHLEFVGCLARGAELKKRVESVVEVTRTHQVGFANFYGALGEKVTSQTKYAGAVLGDERTFCVVPRDAKGVAGNPAAGSKRSAPSGSRSSSQQPSPKRRAMHSDDPVVNEQMAEGEQVQDFAQDPTKNKGHWVRCVNANASDEITAHTTMFAADSNPDYHGMLTRARDQIEDWVVINSLPWYEASRPG